MPSKKGSLPQAAKADSAAKAAKQPEPHEVNSALLEEHRAMGVRPK